MSPPSSAMPGEAPPSGSQVAAVVSFYMTAALMMVFVNKAVLNSSPEVPMTFLFIQLFIAVLIFQGLAHFSRSSTFHLPRPSLSILWNMFPVVFTAILGLVFNTLCLRDVDASFFQVARGLLIPFTIMVSAVYARAAPRAAVIRAALIVTLGFALGAAPSNTLSETADAVRKVVKTGALPSTSGSMSDYATTIKQMAMSKEMIGVLFGSMSAFLTALHAVMVKGALTFLDENAEGEVRPAKGASVIQLTYWTNAMGAAMILPLILFNGEIGPFVKLMSDVTETAVKGVPTHPRTTFLFGALITGAVGCLLCLAGTLSIKVTSPITHMFSGAVRSVLMTLLGIFVMGDIVDERRITSITVITLGAVYYTYVQSAGRAPNPHAPAIAMQHAKHRSNGNFNKEVLFNASNSPSGSDEESGPSSPTRSGSSASRRSTIGTLPLYQHYAMHGRSKSEEIREKILLLSILEEEEGEQQQHQQVQQEVYRPTHSPRRSEELRKSKEFQE